MVVDKALRRAAAPLTLAVCTSALERARGLLGRPPPEPGCGLWIVPCNAVHTWGMRYAIDVVFLDARGLVLCVVPECRPQRVVAHPEAHSVLELRSGDGARLGLRPGERLALPAYRRPAPVRAEAGPDARSLVLLGVLLTVAFTWLLV